MFRRTLISLFSFLALAGNLVANTEPAAPKAPNSLALSATSRSTEQTIAVPLSELPDAPSAVVAFLETRADEVAWQYEAFGAQPQIGPQIAHGMHPEIQFAPAESVGFATNSRHNLLPADLRPDTSSGFHLFLRRSSTPTVFASALFDAAMAQHKNDWPGYGRGLEGFSKRYGALMADRTTSRFFGGFLMPALFHQDPRYRRLGPGLSIWQRMEYSVSRVVLTHSETGGDTLNSSPLLSTFLSKSVQNLYYPRQQRGLDLTLRRIEKSLIGQLQSNLEQEFLPDIERFIWKHLPARIKRFEKRIPFSREWEPESFSS